MVNAEPVPEVIRFSEHLLAALDPDTSAFLAAEGLPRENPVFSANASGEIETRSGPGGMDLVCFGESLNGEGAQICIGVGSGTVLEYRPDFGDSIYVNKDVKSFADTLKLFSLPAIRYSAEGEEDELDIWLRVSADVRSGIAAIDTTALTEGEDFWGTILMEIANGDWSDEGLFEIVDSAPDQ